MKKRRKKDSDELQVDLAEDLEGESEDDLSADLSELEAADIRKLLRKFEVRYPDSAEIGRTIEAVRFQMQLAHKAGLWLRLRQLLRLIHSEFMIMNRFYWIASLMLYIGGLIMITSSFQETPHFSLFMLAPVPFILGLAELFRSRDVGMLEMEMCCRYNGASVMLARLCIVGFYNILLNLLCSVWLAGTWGQLLLWEVTLMWLTPFTCVSGVALLAAIHLRGSTAVMLIISAWLSFCLILILNPGFIRTWISMDIVTSMVLLGLGSLFAVRQIFRVVHKISEIEGVGRFETGHR